MIDDLINAIDDKGLKVRINSERPIFVQPEDRIAYRAHRVLLILNHLNTTRGLSKEVIACMDFLLRNPAYQKKFILVYFKDQRNIISKVSSLASDVTIEMDINLVQYKSVPWDLRFNDMFLYLVVRELVDFIGSAKNARVVLSDRGKAYAEQLNEVFPSEVNFLEIFGKRLAEKKSIDIITNVIPNTYWKENEKLIY